MIFFTMVDRSAVSSKLIILDSLQGKPDCAVSLLRKLSRVMNRMGLNFLTMQIEISVKDQFFPPGSLTRNVL